MDNYDVKYLRASTFMLFLVLAALTGCLAELGFEFKGLVIVLMVYIKNIILLVILK